MNTFFTGKRYEQGRKNVLGVETFLISYILRFPFSYTFSNGAEYFINIVNITRNYLFLKRHRSAHPPPPPPFKKLFLYTISAGASYTRVIIIIVFINKSYFRVQPVGVCRACNERRVRLSR